MNMKVTEPTAVILVGTWALLFFVRFIIINFSPKCPKFRFVHFSYCVVIFNKKVFLRGVLFMSLFGYVTELI